MIMEAVLAPQYDSQRYVDEYLKTHMKRFAQTTSLLQKVADPKTRIVDIASYGSLVPVRVIGATQFLCLQKKFRGRTSAIRPFFMSKERLVPGTLSYVRI